MSSTLNELINVLKGDEYQFIKARLNLFTEINKEMGNSLTIKQAFELWSQFIARMGAWHRQKQEDDFIEQVTTSTNFVVGDLVDYCHRYDTFREIDSDFRNGEESYLRSRYDGFEENFEKDVETLMSLIVRYNIVRIRYV